MTLAQIVTIDGPAGCGKSTVVRALATQMDGLAFSSGLIYRALTWLALEKGVGPADKLAQKASAKTSECLLKLLKTHQLKIVEAGKPPELRVFVDGVDPGAELHTARVTRDIHWIADDPLVRAALLPMQHNIECHRLLFTEGRDMGTVVFPTALLKVFLTATVAERARRRWLELGGENHTQSQAEVVAEVERRDAHDTGRKVAPLIKPENALEVDSTALSVEQIVKQIRSAIEVAQKNVLKQDTETIELGKQPLSDGADV